MAIAVTCSQCGFSRSVPDEFGGKRGKCPKCGAIVVVPVMPPSLEDETATVRAKPQAARPDEAAKDTASKGAAKPAPLRRATPVAPRQVEPPAEPAEPPEVESESSADWMADTLSPSAAPSSRAHKSAGKRSQRKTEKHVTDDESRATKKHRGQAHPFGLPVPLWTVVVAVCIVVLVTGVNLYLFFGRGEPEVAQNKPKPAVKKKKAAEDEQATKSGPPEEYFGPAKKEDASKKPGEKAELEDVFAYVKPGIVVIEVFNEGQQLGMGSGFIVDKTGLLITNYHVISPGNAAYAQFTDGSRVEIAGYVSVKPEWDLAVLKLKEAPANLRVLDLVHDNKPREASKVMAVGSPLGHTFVPTSGIVGRFVQGVELPADAREFVLDQTGNDEQFWIEHNAQIAPGNSGGPLFDYRGNVIGINSWVDGRVRFGYAIWAWYAYDLIAHPLPAIAPLQQYRKADLSPLEALAGSGDLSATGLQKLFDAGETMEWQPKDAGDYLRLQEFSRVLTIAMHGKEIGLPADLSSKAIELGAKLAAVQWDAKQQIEPINKLAVTALTKPSGGTFIFGKIKSKQSRGRQTILIIEVLNSSELLCAPVSGLAATFQEGVQCLVMANLTPNRLVYATPSEGRHEAMVLGAPIVVPTAK